MKKTVRTALYRVAVALCVLALVVSTVPLPAMAEHDGASHVSISEIQTPDGDGTASPYAGENVTTDGVVTATTADGFYIQNGTGAYSGVYVYGTPNATVEAGDTVNVTAAVKEYYGLTELDISANYTSVSVTGAAAVPDAADVTTADAGTEAYEGVLVNVTDLTATSTPDENGEWDVTDGSSPVAVDDIVPGGTDADATPSNVNATLSHVEGPVHYGFGEFKLRPVSLGAIQEPGTDDSGSAALAPGDYTPISAIQEPTDDSDDTPLAGENVTTKGVVTGSNGEGVFIQNGTGPWRGLIVEGAGDLSMGDVVTVNGTPFENFDATRIDADSVNVTGTSALPDPVMADTGAVSAERWEGVRVRVTDVNVTQTPNQYTEWLVSDGSGDVMVDTDASVDTTTPSEAGLSVESITGPVHFAFGNFQIHPTEVAGLETPAPGSEDPSLRNASELSVVSYNDLQTAVSDPVAMGELAGVIEQRRTANAGPTLVVGGGDQVSPSSLSPVSNWTVPVQVLNEVDPAAEVVGNHDLDFGFEPVEAFSDASEFPWLVANIRGEDNANIPGTQNYTIVERGNVSVGIVGLVDDAVETKTAVDFGANGYEVTDFNTAGSRIATELKEEENVDFVVASAHIGVPESEELARNTDNIDLIVTGDDEQRYGPTTVSDTVIMEAGGNAEAVAEANFSVNDTAARFENGRLIDLAGGSPPIDEAANETVSQLVNESRGEYLSTVAGVSEVELDSTSANYEDETRWGNLIGDAFLAQTGADVAITNAGGIRGDFTFGPGEITYDDIYSSLPFGNTLVTKALSGTQLRNLLASQAGVGEYGYETALQVGGVHYEVNVRDDGIPVSDVYVQGEPLDPEATYNVTLNSYMAGWSALPGQPYSVDVVNQTTVSTDLTLYGTAAVNYIENNTPVAPGDTNRIRRVTHEAGETTLAAEGDALRTTFDVPDSVEGVSPETFYAMNATTGTLDAAFVSHDAEADTVTVGFDRAAYTQLAAASEDIQLYGKYDTSAFEFEASFERAVLNAELETDGELTDPSRTVALSVGEGTDGIDTPLGDTTEIPVYATGATDGIGAYELTVSVGNGDVARIAGLDAAGTDALTEVTYSEDRRTAHVEVALADLEGGDDTTELATVELAGVSLDGRTGVELAATAGPYDRNGSAYAVERIDNRALDVTPGDVTGNGLTMADPDDDGAYDDVNGDGSVDVVDAQALFAARDTDPVTHSAPAFDFNGDGAVNVGDVQALFATTGA